MDGIELALADPDFYVPVERWPAPDEYAPRGLPAGWCRRSSGVWTYWTPDGTTLATQGWKVHVSARLARAGRVLDVVAGVCAAHGAPFKHLRSRQVFLWIHHKHGPRQQAGKFCAIYPADPAAAERLMTALAAALAGERGPYVLTDRRFGSSQVVSYRYGGFTPRSRVQPDGTRLPLLVAPDGTEVVDQRLPRFHLPEWVSDPFETARPAGPASGAVSFHGYTFTAVLQHSNSGGAYQATTPDGQEVFVKEARRHNGYQWDGSTATRRLRAEHRILRELHAAAPGVGPEPLDLFRRWEHTFLVTELVPGQTLLSWVARHSPLSQTDRDPATFRAYYDRCRRLLDRLWAQIARLHQAGYAFRDLNPRNVLVEDDHPRLIDFEEARPIGDRSVPHGAEGFLPPEMRRQEPESRPDGRYYDEYALAALAQLLLHPLHPVLERNPDAAAHLAADLPVFPEELWRRAGHGVRSRVGDLVGVLPHPDQVADEPGRWVRWLRDRVCDGLEAVLDPAGSPPFPITPPAYLSNPYQVAHGLAGIAHAMHRAGRPLPRRAVAWLVDGALRDRDDLPPGLLSGTAGIAWVLADLGYLDAAADLLTHADRHPITGRDATLGHGLAGVALAHLALFRHDRDPRRLEQAAGLLRAIPDDPGPLLGRDDPTGWRLGRPGLALALGYLADLTGDDRAARLGTALLRHDLDRAHPDGDGMQFPVSQSDQRVEPYLAAGSAGFALVAGRYLAAGRGGEELRSAHRRCLATLRAITAPVLPGLFDGLAGMGLVLADPAGPAGSGTHGPAAAALRSARALFKYAVPHGDGLCFRSAGRRISASLADGAAGVLLFLDQVCDPRPDPLFTLDALAGDPGRRTPDVLPWQLAEVPELSG